MYVYLRRLLMRSSTRQMLSLPTKAELSTEQALVILHSVCKQHRHWILQQDRRWVCQQDWHRIFPQDRRSVCQQDRRCGSVDSRCKLGSQLASRRRPRPEVGPHHTSSFGPRGPGRCCPLRHRSGTSVQSIGTLTQCAYSAAAEFCGKAANSTFWLLANRSVDLLHFHSDKCCCSSFIPLAPPALLLLLQTLLIATIANGPP